MVVSFVTNSSSSYGVFQPKDNKLYIVGCHVGILFLEAIFKQAITMYTIFFFDSEFTLGMRFTFIGYIIQPYDMQPKVPNPSGITLFKTSLGNQCECKSI